MLLNFRKVELVLLDSFAIAVMALSIGLAMMTMLTAFALIAILGCHAKLKCWKQRKMNECAKQAGRGRSLQVSHPADRIYHRKQIRFYSRKYH